MIRNWKKNTTVILDIAGICAGEEVWHEGSLSLHLQVQGVYTHLFSEEVCKCLGSQALETKTCLAPNNTCLREVTLH